MSDKTVKISLFLLFFLNIVDATTTLVLINAGLAEEWNPLMKLALEQGIVYFIFIKFMAVIIACLVFWTFRNETATKYGIVACLAGYSLLLTHFCIGLL